MADPGDAGGTGTFRVGDFVVDRATGVVKRGSAEVELEPRVQELLEYLVQNSGRPVSKNELLDVVWGGAYVTEHALWRAVSKLRRAFDDDSRHPRIIATLPRRGYMFVGEIRQAPGAETPERPSRGLRGPSLPITLGVVAVAALAAMLWSRGDGRAKAIWQPTWAQNAAEIERLEAARTDARLPATKTAYLSAAYSRQWVAVRVVACRSAMAAGSAGGGGRGDLGQA